MKNRLKLKKQIKALKALECATQINIDTKVNKSFLLGAICLSCGGVGNFIYPSILNSGLSVMGILFLGNSILKTRNSSDKFIYNNSYKYHRYDMYESMNNYITLYNLHQELKSKNVNLSCDDIEHYIREIVYNNYLYLRNEKSKSYVKKANSDLRLKYAEKSLSN